MRALLVVNPAATTTERRSRDVVLNALASECKVDLAETRHRGHARELAAGAAVDGLDVVVVLGGDGTVNEVVNGLLSEGPQSGLPALGVVPGGCANVFARAAGLPADAVAATAALLDALRTGRSRTVGVGRLEADPPGGAPVDPLAGPPAGVGRLSRYFTFCAGLGLDAATVARVERRRGPHRSPTAAGYVGAGVREFVLGTERRHPPLELSDDDGTAAVYLALVCNTTPWTYLGSRPVRPCPAASFDTGLDVFALRRLSTVGTLRHLAQILSRSGRAPHGRALRLSHDQRAVTVRATGAVDHRQPVQTDGEYLGDAGRIVCTSVPAAIRVLG